MKDIRVIKLATGEDIVCEVISDSAFEILIKNPLRAVIVPAKVANAGPQIALAPFSPYVLWNDGVGIRSAQVVFNAPAVPELVDEYKSVFSPILTPPKSGLIV